MEYSVIVPVVDIWSNFRPRFQAAIVPIQRPMTIDRIVEVPTSTTVGHSRSSIRPRTDWLYW